MKNTWKDRFDLIFENRIRRAIALALAVVVTFTTTYSLVLPAITLEKETAETMSGINLGGNEQGGDVSASSPGDDSGDAGTVSFDAEAKNDDGETESLVHVEADEGAFPEGTTMEASAVTDQEVIDSITESAEGDVVAVRAVDLTFSDENGDTVHPAEGSRVSVTISTGDGNTTEDLAGETSGDDAPDGQTTETTVVQYSEENGAEQIETNEEVSLQVEPENDLNVDSAVSFDISEQTGEQGSQTYAIVETVPENDVKEESFTGEAEADSPEDSGTGPEAEEPASAEPEIALQEMPEEAEGSVLTARSESYLVSLTCGPEAQLPQGASLRVEEILSKDRAFEDHLEKTQGILNETVRTETPEEGIYAGPEAAAPQFFGSRSLMADPDGFDRRQTAAESAPEAEILYARFFDIAILDASGNEIEPAAPVKVAIELLDAEQEEAVLQSADAPQVIHFGEETEVVEAEVIKDAVAGVTFDAAGFSVYGVVYSVVTNGQITGTVITDSGDAYEVTVTYDESAEIPEGSTLRVTEFAEGSNEYDYARNAVLADKKAKGEQVDLGSFNLAALDISIIDPDGNEIEPSATVQVDIRIKELPGVEDLSQVADTLAVQHHVEAEDGVIIETVFEGASDASFRMKTDKAVSSKGVAVDPDSLSDEDFLEPWSNMAGDNIDVSFLTEVFSTFTVTWETLQWWDPTDNTTIHYGYMNGSTFVEFDEQPSPTSVDENHHAYLIYDFEGYQYSGETYYRSSEARNGANMKNNATKIQPRLRYNRGWQYPTYFWNDVADGSHIYVVYDKKAEPTQGGTPTTKQSEDYVPPQGADNHQNLHSKWGRY